MLYCSTNLNQLHHKYPGDGEILDIGLEPSLAMVLRSDNDKSTCTGRE